MCFLSSIPFKCLLFSSLLTIPSQCGEYPPPGESLITPGGGEEATGKRGFLIPNITQLSEIKVAGAKKGDPCDMNLYTTYTVPVYEALKRAAYVEKHEALRTYLTANANLEPQSCYSYQHNGGSGGGPRWVFLKCNSAGGGTATCDCIPEGPFASKASGGRSGCSLLPPTVGSPCSNDRSREVNGKFLNGLRNQVSALLTDGTLPNKLKNVLESVLVPTKAFIDEQYITADYRRACLVMLQDQGGKTRSISPQPMECGVSNKCECVRKKRFFYSPSSNGCAADRLSTCELSYHGANSDITYYYTLAACRESGDECRSAAWNQNGDIHLHASTKFRACYESSSTHWTAASLLSIGLTLILSVLLRGSFMDLTL